MLKCLNKYDNPFAILYSKHCNLLIFLNAFCNELDFWIAISRRSNPDLHLYASKSPMHKTKTSKQQNVKVNKQTKLKANPKKRRKRDIELNTPKFNVLLGVKNKSTTKTTEQPHIRSVVQHNQGENTHVPFILYTSIHL